MIFLLVLVFLMTSAFAAISNPDIFSPAKIFLFFFMTFHLGILTADATQTTILMIMVVLSVGLVAVVIEAGRIKQVGSSALPAGRSVAPGASDSWKQAAFMWAVSVPALAAQAYMIVYFGGIEGYVNSIGLRVVEWAGLGWARTLIALLTPINMVYFALGARYRRGKRWWLLYGLHFLILLSIGFLSGSRSSILNIFTMQIIIYHYLRSNVKVQSAGLLAGALVLSAMLLGVVRESTRFDAGELVISSTSGRTLSFQSFYYGVDPLEIIARTEHLPLAHGMTFVSLVTNAVPRSIWPDKPLSGGVFFTRYYTGDAWEGYSNLTPTFLGEWIINFGWTAGIIGFFFSYLTLMFLIDRYYYRILTKASRDMSPALTVDLVIYAHILLTFVALMIGEVTNVVLNLILSQLIPLWAMRYYLKRSSA